MTNEELIVVIQAEIDGKEIEHRCVHSIENPWLPKPKAWVWNCPAFEYRVKPEMKVMYINIYPGTYLSDRKSADQMAGDSRSACVRVEYTEGQFDA